MVWAREVFASPCFRSGSVFLYVRASSSTGGYKETRLLVGVTRMGAEVWKALCLKGGTLVGEGVCSYVRHCDGLRLFRSRQWTGPNFYVEHFICRGIVDASVAVSFECAKAILKLDEVAVGDIRTGVFIGPAVAREARFKAAVHPFVRIFCEFFDLNLTGHRCFDGVSIGPAG